MFQVILRSGIWGLLSRGVISVSQLVFLPFLFDIYGKSNFGLLMTLVSLNAFLSLSNLGVSKSMQNKISSLDLPLENNQALHLLKSCLLFITKCALILFLLLFIIYLIFYKTIENLSVTLVLFFLIGGFFTVQLNVVLDYFRGMHKPDLANKKLFFLNGSSIVLIGLLILFPVNMERYYLLVYVFPPMVFCLLQLIQLNVFGSGRTARKRISVFDKSARNFLVLTGIQFLGFGAGTFLVSNILGTEKAAEYAIVFRFYNLLLFGFTVFTSSSWPFITKLHSQKDIISIRKLLKRLTFFALAYLFIATYFLSQIAPVVVQDFMGLRDVVTFELFSAMSLQLVVVMATSFLIPILNAFDILRIQIIFGILNVIVGTLLNFVLLEMHGVCGAPYATALSNLLFGVIPLSYVLFLVIKNYDSIPKESQ